MWQNIRLCLERRLLEKVVLFSKQTIRMHFFIYMKKKIVYFKDKRLFTNNLENFNAE